jgi:hypothetical protein
LEYLIYDIQVVRGEVPPREKVSHLDKFKWRQHIQIMERAMNLYAAAVDDTAIEILNERGLVNVLERVTFGYAPHDHYLRDNGMSLKELETTNLINDYGKEVFSGRIVFPISRNGAIVHMQGRAIDPEAQVRWLSMRTPDSISPINRYLYGEDFFLKRSSIETLVVSEGISDTLSVREIRVPAVGTFGVDIDFSTFGIFERVETAIFMFDNDVFPLGSPLGGLYKSWSAAFRGLLALRKKYPAMNILCCPPPRSYGKDSNDWLRSGELTQESFQQWVYATKRPLEKFMIEEFGHRLDFQTLLLKLVGVNEREEDVSLLREKALNIEPDPIRYAMRLICQS